MTQDKRLRRGLVRRFAVLLHLPFSKKQVMDKCNYYSQAEWAKRDEALHWAQDTYLQLKDPFRVHNVYDYPGWLEHFHGKHPPQVLAMWHDILDGNVDSELRKTEDIERLLRTPDYRLGRALLKGGNYVAMRSNSLPRLVKRLFLALRRRGREILG